MKERNGSLAAGSFNARLNERRTATEYLAVGGGSVGSARCRGNGSGVHALSALNRKVAGARSLGASVIAQPTTHQKVRRIIEEHAERRRIRSGGPRTRIVVPSSSSSSSASSSDGGGSRRKSHGSNNYTIVASYSRGDKHPSIRDRPSPGFSSFSVRETRAADGKEGEIDPAGKSPRPINRRQDIPDSPGARTGLPCVDRADRKQRRTGVAAVTVVRAREPRRLSWGAESLEEDRRDGDGSEFGQSSGSLGSLQGEIPGSFGRGNGRETGEPSERKTAEISRDRGIAAAGTGPGENRRSNVERSPAVVATLPNSWKKPARVGVKKSVSFSSDTSFEERKSFFRSKTQAQAHAHEAKVYRRGVLQDRASPSLETLRGSAVTSASTTTTTSTATTTTTTTTTTPWGSSAFLKAAREGDNRNLGQIMARAKTPQGSREMNVNATDASGRTAISYMAGNGAVAMLQVVLSFPEVDVNLADNEGNAPLHFASQAGQPECLSVLLQRCSGIETDARNQLGFTPLMKAAVQGRTKCAKILLFAGANPTLRDHGRGLRAEQWARFCGRHACAEVMERFARHRLPERTTSCRWGSEPELAARVLQGKVTLVPGSQKSTPQRSTGFKSKIRRVFRTSSGPENRSFSLVSQLTSAALCASSPALPRPGDVPPLVESLARPLSVPQLRITLVAASSDAATTTQPDAGVTTPGPGPGDAKFRTNFTEKIASEKFESPAVTKPPRSKKKNK